MKVAASVESLWQYIQSLSLSERNRKWLATKLLENNYTKEDERRSAFNGSCSAERKSEGNPQAV